MTYANPIRSNAELARTAWELAADAGVAFDALAHIETSAMMCACVIARMTDEAARITRDWCDTGKAGIILTRDARLHGADKSLPSQPSAWCVAWPARSERNAT